MDFTLEGPVLVCLARTNQMSILSKKKRRSK